MEPNAFPIQSQAPIQPPVEPKKKGISWKIIVSVLILMIAVAMFARGMFMISPQPQSVENTSDWKTYDNAYYGYEFKYPENFDEWQAFYNFGFLGIPDLKTVEGTKFIHSIDLEHCGPSGLPEHCKPTTEDMVVAVYPIKRKYEEVLAAYTKRFPNSVEETQVSSKTGFTIPMHVEGEGQIQYVIPLGVNTLVLIRDFIDENVVGIYKNRDDFLPIVEQEKLFNQILSTFKFIEKADTSTWKTYRNEECGYEIKYPPEWATVLPDGCSIGLASPERQEAYKRFVERKIQGDIQISNVSVYVTDWTKPLGDIDLYGKRKIDFLSQPAYEGFNSGLGDFYVVATARNSKLYTISISGGAILRPSSSFQKTLSPLQEQILSTFRFTK